MILGALLLFLHLILSPSFTARTPPTTLSATISKFLDKDDEGTRWALLVAGSRGYVNYRHQADVCHAFQILKKGGLKEENIVVFMYDDIAFNEENPRQGVIVNSPTGADVYQGVPKDYTGNNTNIQNLFSVMLGNTSGLIGGSGKVLNSGPKDRVFIYYTDHGGAGMVDMASDELLYADDLINVLKRMHEAKAYASMVFYLEACESGSMFEGLLPETLNIYAVTASNATEFSYATYCPSYESDQPKNLSSTYDVCLGDLFSVSWMEDSDKHDLRSETLGQQLQVVKQRTAAGDSKDECSNVMQYGSVVLSNESLSTYMGATAVPVSDNNYTWVRQSAAPSVVSQRDAVLLHYHHKIYTAPNGSNRSLEAQKQLFNELISRKLADNNMKKISSFLFGAEDGIVMMHTVRPGGKPLVDDWTCLKTFVRIYEEHCGALSKYGKKYTRSMANMCNAGITAVQMNMAARKVCK